MPDPTIWHLYIILCRDGTYYTGITNNIDQRIHDHNHGKGCRYTKYRWPVRVMYSEPHADKASAMKREAQIQGWSRCKKEMLINGPAKYFAQGILFLSHILTKYYQCIVEV